MNSKNIATLLVISLAAAGALAGDMLTATGEVAFESATDQTRAIQTSDGEVPGRDIAALRIASDGTHLTLTATLTEDPSGTFADNVVRIHVDTDNDASTGTEATWTEVQGFEFEIELSLCIEYDNGATACVGGAGDKVTSYFATAGVTDTATGDKLKPFWDLPQTPVEGRDVSAQVTYEDLGVKPGQTIRIYARESSGPFDTSGYFPQALLTLK